MKSATVEYVGEGRDTQSLDGFWRSLTPEQLKSVEAVGMDMWEPYLKSTRAHLPDAERKIVHDPFHLVRYLNQAVGPVRIAEYRTHKAMGDDRLKGSKQLWLYGLENLPERWQLRLEQLQNQKLKTGRAWSIKEYFRDMWT
ncbi:MAG: transposase [Kiritimatiellae bacterium]|nr:transposase [Kiritimatiellia bacterium]